MAAANDGMTGLGAGRLRGAGVLAAFIMIVALVWLSQ